MGVLFNPNGQRLRLLRFWNFTTIDLCNNRFCINYEYKCYQFFCFVRRLFHFHFLFKLQFSFSHVVFLQTGFFCQVFIFFSNKYFRLVRRRARLYFFPFQNHLLFSFFKNPGGLVSQKKVLKEYGLAQRSITTFHLFNWQFLRRRLQSKQFLRKLRLQSNSNKWIPRSSQKFQRFSTRLSNFSQKTLRINRKFKKNLFLKNSVKMIKKGFLYRFLKRPEKPFRWTRWWYLNEYRYQRPEIRPLVYSSRNKKLFKHSVWFRTLLMYMFFLKTNNLLLKNLFFSNNLSAIESKENVLKNFFSKLQQKMPFKRRGSFFKIFCGTQLRSFYSKFEHPFSKLGFLFWNLRDRRMQTFMHGQFRREFFPFQKLVTAIVKKHEFQFKIKRIAPKLQRMPNLLMLKNLFNLGIRALFGQNFLFTLYLTTIRLSTITARYICRHLMHKIVYRGLPKGRRNHLNRRFFKEYGAFLKKNPLITGCQILLKGRVVRQQRCMYKWVVRYGIFARNTRSRITSFASGVVRTRNGVLGVKVYISRINTFSSISRTRGGTSIFDLGMPDSILRVFFSGACGISSSLKQFETAPLLLHERNLFWRQIPTTRPSRRSGFPSGKLQHIRLAFRRPIFQSARPNLSRRRVKKLLRLQDKKTRFRIL